MSMDHSGGCVLRNGEAHGMKTGALRSQVLQYQGFEWTASVSSP